MSPSGLTWGDMYLCSSKRQAEEIIFEGHVYKELGKIIPSIWTKAQQYLKKEPQILFTAFSAFFQVYHSCYKMGCCY